jgi:hypothetical protein
VHHANGRLSIGRKGNRVIFTKFVKDHPPDGRVDPQFLGCPGTDLPDKGPVQGANGLGVLEPRQTRCSRILKGGLA